MALNGYHIRKVNIPFILLNNIYTLKQSEAKYFFRYPMDIILRKLWNYLTPKSDFDHNSEILLSQTGYLSSQIYTTGTECIAYQI